MIHWIMIIIIILLVTFLFGFLIVRFKMKKNWPTDHRAMFYIGITWLALGIISMRNDNPFFFIMGLVFIAIGLVNKDKWEKNKRSLGTMSKEEKKLFLGIFIFLGVLFLIGVVVFFLVQKGILNF
jgi:hypothetical protein